MSEELSDVLASFPDSYRIAVMRGDEAVDVGLSVGNLTVMAARSDALYASQVRIEELEQKLRTTSLEALAISDTNNEMAVRIAELQAEVQQLDQSAREARGAAYAWETRDEASQARLSEAVKVLEKFMDFADQDYVPNGMFDKAKTFIATLGEAK